MGKVGLRVFCLVIWPVGSRDWNVVVTVRMAPIGSSESPLDGAVWVGSGGRCITEGEF